MSRRRFASAFLGAWLVLGAGAVSGAAQEPAPVPPPEREQAPEPPVPANPEQEPVLPPDVRSEDLPEVSEPAESPLGPPVVEIEVRSDAPLERFEDLMPAIEIEVGKPLTELDVRHTLRNLQATGIASEIELYSREVEGGVVAILVFRAATLVEKVQFSGTSNLSRSALQGAVPQKEGQPLSEEKVLQGVQSLERLLGRAGYFEGKVRLDVATDEIRRRATITYDVESGIRATVRTIEFDHDTDPFAPALLAQQLRLAPGRPYRPDRARGDAERLQRFLVGKGYALARVDRPVESYDAESHTVKLVFPIRVGPKFELVVVGAERKTLQRKGLLPFLGEDGYDDALLFQALGRIKSFYQKQGHYDVKIDHSEEKTDRLLRVTLTVVPGPKFVLRSVDFFGNDSFPKEELLDLMSTSRKSLLQLGSGRLVDDDLDDDIDNVRRFYATRGFREAVVGPANIQREGDTLRLTVPVKEGARQTVARLGFDGFDELQEGWGQLMRSLPLQEEGGFHPVLLSESLAILREAFEQRGYADSTVSARESWNDDRTRVSLAFDAIAGPQRVIDRVIVRGNERTQPDVIRRTLGLGRDEPASRARLLDAERDLYRLGIFSRVDVDLLPGEPGVSERDLLVRIEEGKPRGIVYGVGYDTQDGPRALVGFTHNNVFGRAYSLRADARYSQPDQRARVVFRQPYLWEHPISLTSTLFYEKEDRNEQSFEVRRSGIRSEAARQYGRLRATLGLEYRQVRLRVEEGAASNDIERRDQPYRLTNLLASAFHDRRNDPLDARRGGTSLAQLQYAFPAFYTDAEFVKLFLQQTQNLDLGRLGVVAASVRLAGIEAFSQLETDPSDPLSGYPSRNVFISERLFAGGPATHRAFGLDELGILGETLFPKPGATGAPLSDPLKLGGNGLALFNLEYRFPLFGIVGGLVFFDTGNVWADWRRIDPKDFRHGVGFGVRAVTPIGPLSAGLGWKLDRQDGESAYEIFVNVGNPF